MPTAYEKRGKDPFAAQLPLVVVPLRTGDRVTCPTAVAIGQDGFQGVAAAVELLQAVQISLRAGGDKVGGVPCAPFQLLHGFQQPCRSAVRLDQGALEVEFDVVRVQPQPRPCPIRERRLDHIGMVKHDDVCCCAGFLRMLHEGLVFPPVKTRCDVADRQPVGIGAQACFEFCLSGRLRHPGFPESGPERGRCSAVARLHEGNDLHVVGR